MPKNAICQVTGLPFTITDREIEFCVRMGVPIPKEHPIERIRHLMAFSNERTLYKRKCDGTGEEVIGLYSTKSPYKVFKHDYWLSANWEAPSMDYDFSRPFFEQFRQLQLKTPRVAVWVLNSENCNYCNYWYFSKDCYLCFQGLSNRDCLFSYRLFTCNDCVDCVYSRDAELCYFCVYCDYCFNLQYSEDCRHSRDSAFLKDCRNCNHCFMCSNLRNCEYYIRNKKYSPQEYEAEMKKITFNSESEIERLKQEFEELKKSAFYKENHNEHCENSVGDYLEHTKNCYFCFFGQEIEDCLYVYRTANMKNVMDSYSSALGCEVCYQVQTVIYSPFSKFSNDCDHCHDIEYCDLCLHTANSFGCVGLRHKEYCILNKQYSREEYGEIVKRIKVHMEATGEWGKFFPYNFSPYPFRDTAAQMYYPLTDDEIQKRGANIKEEEPIFKPKNPPMPPDIFTENRESEVLNTLYYCEETGRPFKIIKKELEFYKKHSIPIPRLHPETRFKKLFSKLNLPRLYKRKCFQEGKEILTTFPLPPDGPEKVLCEKSYLERIG